eukprot:g804.t1
MTRSLSSMVAQRNVASGLPMAASVMLQRGKDDYSSEFKCFFPEYAQQELLGDSSVSSNFTRGFYDRAADLEEEGKGFEKVNASLSQSTTAFWNVYQRFYGFKLTVMKETIKEEEYLTTKKRDHVKSIEKDVENKASTVSDNERRETVHVDSQPSETTSFSPSSSAIRSPSSSSSSPSHTEASTISNNERKEDIHGHSQSLGATSHSTSSSSSSRSSSPLSSLSSSSSHIDERGATNNTKGKKSGGSSYYKQIKGVKYDRELLEMSESFAKPLSLHHAHALIQIALDGHRLTPIEVNTLRHLLKTEEFTKEGKWLFEKFLDNSTEHVWENGADPNQGSYYQQINGKRLDRGLLHKAETFQLENSQQPLSENQAKDIIKASLDSGSLTAIEVDTIEHITETHAMSDGASQLLRDFVDNSRQH